MPVSKPNRRWSRKRRWQERRAVAPRLRGDGEDMPAGGVIHDGTSVFDPMTHARMLGRFQGTVIASAFSHSRRGPLSWVVWLSLAGVFLFILIWLGAGVI
jgi:hypothetical protein